MIRAAQKGFPLGVQKGIHLEQFWVPKGSPNRRRNGPFWEVEKLGNALFSLCFRGLLMSQRPPQMGSKRNQKWGQNVVRNGATNKPKRGSKLAPKASPPTLAFWEVRVIFFIKNHIISLNFIFLH